MFKELVLNNRSYRRFVENERISKDLLVELIDTARFVPSTVNSQPLKFKLITDEKTCDTVFESLSWAGLIREWSGPEKGERPSAYILILGDLEIGVNKRLDVGITAQTIMLAAVEKGISGCMLGAIDRSKLFTGLGINKERYSIELVLALGKANETVKLINVPESGSTAYFRDENSVHYVPKRSIDELIID